MSKTRAPHSGQWLLLVLASLVRQSGQRPRKRARRSTTAPHSVQASSIGVLSVRCLVFSVRCSVFSVQFCVPRHEVGGADGEGEQPDNEQRCASIQREKEPGEAQGSLGGQGQEEGDRAPDAQESSSSGGSTSRSSSIWRSLAWRFCWASRCAFRRFCVLSSVACSLSQRT